MASKKVIQRKRTQEVVKSVARGTRPGTKKTSAASAASATTRKSPGGGSPSKKVKKKGEGASSARASSLSEKEAPRNGASKASSTKVTEKSAHAHASGNGKSNGSGSSTGHGASNSAAPGKWQMRLYVAGDSPRSRIALNNLRSLCADRLKEGDYEIEVIDLTKLPHLAKTDQILAVPTLVRSIPEPMKRIIGDLSNADRALVALDFDTLLANQR